MQALTGFESPAALVLHRGHRSRLARHYGIITIMQNSHICHQTSLPIGPCTHKDKLHAQEEGVQSLPVTIIPNLSLALNFWRAIL